MGKSNRATQSATARKAPPGSICNVANIYQDPKDDTSWLPEPPGETGEAAENDKTAELAIIVRNMKSADSRRNFEAHSIIIQSQWLQSILHREILKDYPGVTCEVSRLTFSSPFKPLMHRWPRLEALRRGNSLSETTRGHVELLHKTLTQELGNTRKEYDDHLAQGVVTWDSLWILFEPGMVVISEVDGAAAVYEVYSTKYDTCNNIPTFFIIGEYVDWSGTRFGRGTKCLHIFEFPGTQHIDALSVFPLDDHKNKDKIVTTLTDRGANFQGLAGYHYREYSGLAVTWDTNDNERTIPMHVSGRIIIDIESFNIHSPFSIRRVSGENERDEGALSQGKLTPYHQMLCHPRVRGYYPKMKIWMDFFVAQVHPVQWMPNAFDQLVLHRDQKDLILALVESQRDNGSEFKDIVAGKGQGILALLAGAPGTGKTLTAEAVAEHLRVPLHTIGSGDLGSDAFGIEMELNRTMKLVAHWKAILLVDECDIFLEARTIHDLQRNAVVSVFLRCLEYYEGILFMTTNRSENIDAAFSSRIHLKIQYPDLDPGSRRQIWSNLLKSSDPRHELTEDDLTHLGSHNLNGRQIKNTVKMAQLLALKRKARMSISSINIALGVEQRWEGPTSGINQPGCSSSSTQPAQTELILAPLTDEKGLVVSSSQETPSLKRPHHAEDTEDAKKKKKKKRKEKEKKDGTH